MATSKSTRRSITVASEGPEPLITILIPTRNRRHRVGLLVSNLIENWPVEHRDLVEIIVLNNCSTDGTKAELERIKSPILRVINNEVFHPTSEENVFAGIKHARGDFIWFLGDDDIPRFQTIAQLISLIKADAADFFIFNFRVVDELGRLATVSQVRGAPANFSGRLIDIVKRIGMINMLSGWSIIVARRSMLNVSIAAKIRRVSPIYSHCFWFLSCFGRARSMFVTHPIVDYRVFHSQGGWEDYTEKSNVGYLYYWHLGLLRLFKMAMHEGALTARDVAEIFEYRHNGSKYRAVNEIAFKLIEQAHVYAITGRERELLSEADLNEALDILTDIDLTLGDLCALVRKMFAILRAGAPNIPHDYDVVRTETLALLTARDGDLYEPFFVEMIYGYCIYNYTGSWIGIRVDALSFLDAVFSQFKPQPMPPGVLVAANRAALIRQIGLAPPVPEPVGDRPALDAISMLHMLKPDRETLPVEDAVNVPSQLGISISGSSTAPPQDRRDLEERILELIKMVSERDEIAVGLNEQLIAQSELEKKINKSLLKRLFRKLSQF